MLLAVSLLSAGALLAPSPLAKRSSSSPSLRPPASAPFGGPLELRQSREEASFSPAAAAAGLATLCAMQPEAAFAKGGEYGIFEGRIVSLAHPAVSKSRRLE